MGGAPAMIGAWHPTRGQHDAAEPESQRKRTHLADRRFPKRRLLAMKGGHMRYEQYPETPEFAAPEDANKWLEGEGHHITQQEQEEFLRIYGIRKQPKAIEEHQKPREQAQRSATSPAAG
jgi:hypothetical protein